MAQKNPLTKKNIINSHLLFGDIFDLYSINRVVNLFTTGTIARYVEQERTNNNLSNVGVDIISYIYGTNTGNTTLHLQIKKQKKDFIHLSIHLAPGWLTSGTKDNGIVHIYKDIYDTNVYKKKKYLLYAIYRLEHPPNKPGSLQFSIDHGYSTTSYPSASPNFNSDIKQYDSEVKQEMDVITNVLNKLFDEDNIDYYIGDYHKKYPIKSNEQIQFIEVDNIGQTSTQQLPPNQIKLQKPSEVNNTINNVLQNINKRTTYVKRKNPGVPMFHTRTNKTIPTFRKHNRTQKRPKPKMNKK